MKESNLFALLFHIQYWFLSFVAISIPGINQYFEDIGWYYKDPADGYRQSCTKA
jgi:hypothetical protein